MYIYYVNQRSKSNELPGKFYCTIILIVHITVFLQKYNSAYVSLDGGKVDIIVLIKSSRNFLLLIKIYERGMS